MIIGPHKLSAPWQHPVEVIESYVVSYFHPHDVTNLEELCFRNRQESAVESYRAVNGQWSSFSSTVVCCVGMMFPLKLSTIKYLAFTPNAAAMSSESR